MEEPVHSANLLPNEDVWIVRYIGGLRKLFVRRGSAIATAPSRLVHVSAVQSRFHLRLGAAS